MIAKDNKKDSIEEHTGASKGSTEYNASLELHREYNKLSGFESLKHIVYRYRLVVYIFIVLSILGSAYSFYNDFKIIAPMMGVYSIPVAVILGIVLEIVRDGSLLALFNSKMKPASRVTVTLIFIVVTTFMFVTHFKTIKVIEREAIKYAITNQSLTMQTALNPELNLIVNKLATSKEKLTATIIERDKQINISVNGKYRVNKDYAKSQVVLLDSRIEAIESKINSYESNIVTFNKANIKKVESEQAVISSILLSMLILIEALAMLGGVIKFIH